MSVARAICLRQLEVAARTRAELAATLDDRGVPTDAAAAVLDRFTEAGLIDDDAYAHAWVSSRHRTRGLAPRALAAELTRRGVEGATVAEAVAELDVDTQESTARSLVRRKLRTMSGLEPMVARRRLAGMLARKGYSSDLVLRVVAQEVDTDRGGRFEP